MNAYRTESGGAVIVLNGQQARALADLLAHHCSAEACEKLGLFPSQIAAYTSATDFVVQDFGRGPVVTLR